MKTALPRLATLLFIAASSSLLQAETIVWRNYATGTFSNTANYYIEGTTTRPSSLNATIVFEGPPSVVATNSLAFSFEKLIIREGVSSFILNGTAGITLKEGIEIASGVDAKIDIAVNRYNSAENDLVFHVGSGSSLSLQSVSMGSTTGKEGKFFKTGKGTLAISTGITGGAATQLFLQEGTIELRNDAKIALGTSSAVVVTLGDVGSTGALLRGQGWIDATLTTAGAAYSSIDASGGALKLSHVDASQGTTLLYNLDSFNTLTGTSFTGGNLFFDFSGGEAGTTYTLLDFSSANIDLDTITFNPAYTLDLNFGAEGWLLQNGTLQVRFEAIPEPGTLSLLSLCTMSAIAALYRKRKASLS